MRLQPRPTSSSSSSSIFLTESERVLGGSFKNMKLILFLVSVQKTRTLKVQFIFRDVVDDGGRVVGFFGAFVAAAVSSSSRRRSHRTGPRAIAVRHIGSQGVDRAVEVLR